MKRSRNVGKSSGRRIKLLRRKLGISQGKLAEQLGCNINTVSRWERGDLVPSKIVELAIKYLIEKEDK